MKSVEGKDHARGDIEIEDASDAGCIPVDGTGHAHGDIDKDSTLITREQRSEWIIE